MQNKGFVKVFAVLLTLACIFYLSFSFVTRYQMNKAEKDPRGAAHYLDSMQNQKVWLGVYTLKQCREMEIGLGLDLKGGMNVILEVSVPDVVKALADNKPDAAFNKAVEEAAKQQVTSQEDFITLFVREYKKQAPDGTLAELFATQQLKDKVNTRSTDAEVERVLRQEVQAAIDNSYNVLRTRIDRFGVVQPNIQALEGTMGRIMVELPGIKEPERVRNLLQGSANLEFWETYEAKDIVPVLVSADERARLLLGSTTDSVKVDSAAVEKEKASAAISSKDSLAAVLKGETVDNSAANVEQYKKDHPLLSVFQPNQSGMGSIVGYADYKDTAAVNAILNMPGVKEIMPRDLKLMWGVKASDMDKTGRIFELYAIRSTERNGRAPLEGDVITDARDSYDQFNKPCVTMSMNNDGSRRWAALTKKNIGKEIAIVLDGYVYSAPNVRNEITGGNSEITGNFTPEVTKDLANVLKSGKMPAPARIVQEDIVGPSLGQQSINQGLVSFVVALIALMAYLCVMYGFIPGMVANGALIFNFFFTLGILTSFQAALTLSGIAGMVLSLAMAVDANVLIYERTKEELRLGKTMKDAVSAGYSGAFSAIFDSNLTSIITGVILFYFGTGPIRGFATTLIIGILCSFFTAVFMTRLVYEHYMKKDKWQHLTFSTGVSKNLFQNVHYNFMGIIKRSFTIWGVLLLICIVSFFTRGLSQSIDFTGGRNFVVQFDRVVQPETVRDLLDAKVGDANVQAIALGTDGKRIRVMTNYRIEENDPKVDSEIESAVYIPEGRQSGSEGVTLEHFVDRDTQDGCSIISSQKVGPSVADDMKTSAVWAVVFALIAIGLYILIRFNNIAYSIGATVALAVDAVLVIGAYSLFYGIMPFSLDVDQTFIGAVLTIIGYSINDKVVIFRPCA